MLGTDNVETDNVETDNTENAIMTVAELIEALKGVDPDTVVVIDGEVVHGTEIVSGQIREGYYNPRFVETQPDKARETALRFTTWRELSTGEVVIGPA